MRLLYLEDLRDRGIRFSRQHIQRLVKKSRAASATAKKQGAPAKPAKPRFPPPIKVGEKTNAWIDTEIDQYIEECRAARDAECDAA